MIDKQEIEKIEGYQGTFNPVDGGEQQTCLDGWFTVEELEKIVEYLKQEK